MQNLKNNISLHLVIVFIRWLNARFAQVQKELILHCIRELSVDTLSKKKILNNIANELKIQANKKEIKEL